MTESKSLRQPERNNSEPAPSSLFASLLTFMRFTAKVKNSSRIQTKRWSDHIVPLTVHNTSTLRRYTSDAFRVFIAFTISRAFHCVRCIASAKRPIPEVLSPDRLGQTVSVLGTDADGQPGPRKPPGMKRFFDALTEFRSLSGLPVKGPDPHSRMFMWREKRFKRAPHRSIHS